ncbi:MAG: S-methyl-5-thioribose-1-phosphate isomerase [Candidatus Hodarchaeaceae archaeon]|nr:S-methyl-5-thioribose-1-phosphate isomerase [Candidatus Hodarchaeaceae archaeon]
MRTIELRGKSVVLIDQTRLPHELKLVRCKSADEIVRAIKTMRIRGAPALGVAAAMALAITALRSRARNRETLLRELERAANKIRLTRPTAINPFVSLERVLSLAHATSGDAKGVRKAIVNEARRIADEDVETNRRIGKHGASLLTDGSVVLTHCNTGALACVDYGTALGVIRAAQDQGKKISVLATETRPLLQGARLTAWELMRDDIPVTLITDNMVGYCLSKKLVDAVIVGADRILSDGHLINKIGTYVLAVLAKHHSIPFYSVAPTSTFDLNSKVEDEVIEERKAEEVTTIGGRRIAPRGVPVLNPAFDITPPKLVSAFVTEKGIIWPPFEKNIRETIGDRQHFQNMIIGVLSASKNSKNNFTGCN